MPSTPKCDFEAETILDLDATKAACRRQAGYRRDELAVLEPDAADILSDHAAMLVNRYGRVTFAGYIPIRSELSPLVLLEGLASSGCDLALPVTPAKGQPLIFHRWLVNGKLDDGPYGTKQPPISNEICIPNVILAPMLAFDSNGWRLGYGGGFYDRTLAALRDSRKHVVLIGIAYNGQKLNKVPAGPNDMPLDAVLGPAGLFEPKRSIKN
ncbi:5-formyltetrahydrofolate cyclo-ligase [Candidatus Puniceispirillum sp.]|nr:5-formyltetrahydrofolate cyclo-ligase [Candidatus Puniceispirillum sp.]